MNPEKIQRLLSNRWVALLLIALAAGIIYSNIYHSPFVLDDTLWIVKNEKIQDVNNYLSFQHILTPRTIVYATLAVNYQIGELNVAGYHLFNVLVHIANAFLVYFFSLSIFGRTAELSGLHTPPPLHSIFGSPFSVSMMSLFAALIFATHPIQTQAVTYTIQRLTSLAALFYLASAFLFFKARALQVRIKEGNREPASAGAGKRHKGTSVWKDTDWNRIAGLSVLYGLAFLCGLIAILCKQNTVSLPLAILLLEYLFFDRTWKGWKKKLSWIIPVFLLFVFFVLFVVGVFRGELQFGKLLEDVSGRMRDPSAQVGRWSYLCTQFNVMVIYIRLLFFPIHQSLDHLYSFKESFFAGYTPLAFLFLAGIIATAFWNIRKRPIIALGIFWFFITLSVESSIIPIADAMFEHRLYLPAFGFSVIIAYLVFQICSQRAALTIVFSVAIVLSFGTATYLRNNVWRSNFSIWQDALAKNPKNYRAHVGIGVALHEYGRVETAHEHFLKAIGMRPAFSAGHYNLAVSLERRGNLGGAVKSYSECLQIAPDDTEARYNLAVVLVRTNRVEEAIAQYNRAAGSKRPTALQRSRFQAVLDHYCRKMQLFLPPEDWKGHYELAIALTFQKDAQGAAKAYQQVLKINPDFAEAHNNLGKILLAWGKTATAEKHFKEALRIKPDYKEAQFNLEQCRRRMRAKNKQT